MANTFLTATEISREFLRVLHSNLPFLSTVDRQYDDSTTFGGVKNSGSITIRKPAKFSVRTGASVDVQDLENTSASLSIDTQKGIDVMFSSKELTQDLDSFSKQFIAPAAARLAAQLESDALEGMYKSVWNSVGTPGTTPNSALVWLQGGQKLDESLAPRDGNRYALMNPAAQAATVDALKGLFVPSGQISRQYTDGQMGDAFGLKFNMGQQVPALTVGTRSGTILTDTTLPSTQGATTIHIDGLGGATQTIAAGEVFTVAGVYSVNESGQSTGNLFQFVVQSAATASGSEVDLTVQPMYTTGAKQNISGFPEVDKAVTFLGTASTVYPQNLVYHRDAFTFATVKLDVPRGVDFAAQEVMDGISCRVVRAYDINSDNFICRFDVLYGYVAQRPELACRVWG